MNSKLSKSRVIHARATATPNAINTRLRRHQIGYKARSNASIGFMTKSRSELERLHRENAILLEERRELHNYASYYFAH